MLCCMSKASKKVYLFITNKTEQYHVFFSQESTFKEEWQ